MKAVEFVANKVLSGAVWVVEKVVPYVSQEKVEFVDDQTLRIDSKATPQDAILWDDDDFEMV